MASAQDLHDARARFIALLDTDPETAERLANLMRRDYMARAIPQPRAVVLGAAEWAAQRLNGMSRERLETATDEQVLLRLKRSDCPLCMTDSDDDDRHSGSPAGVPTPVGADA